MTSEPTARKSLGQHWLRDKQVLTDIVNYAELTKSDTVLEIGPGTGTLTEILIEKAGNIIVVELDEKLADQLSKKFSSQKLQIIKANILEFDLKILPAGYKIVANLPYYLSGIFLRLISESENPPSMAVLLLQKEVAQRINAEPGQMSIQAVTTQFFWKVNLGRDVPAELFTPPPKVDSQVLILKRRNKQLYSDVEPDQFFRLVKMGFAQPRKTLLNNLSASLRHSREETQSVLDRASIEAGRRPQTLSLDEWRSLYQALHT
ncbi:MAG TPA: 16S rRNA (adenine(1518)-N(6)/adenine(1519)-N(6))-dimethyltransferase RsmA [Candidatus Saccharimonadales bacterium]|nr:16S rRNA (adenine(1518)-N(6)/adenine(1519)-N(6))-dimethyltransferase RsmA [Candidatus Saccharimonadales bacterium]